VRALLRGLKTTGLGEHQQLLSAVVQQVFPNIKLFEAFTDSFLSFSHMYFFIILNFERKVAKYLKKKNSGLAWIEDVRFV